MTWRHRGVPYARSTGGWLEINTVTEQPIGPDVLTSGRAIVIRDNSVFGTGRGLGLISRDGIMLQCMDNAGLGGAYIGLFQEAIDGSGRIELISGYDPASDNGNIIIDTAHAGGARGDLTIRAGTAGSAVDSGNIDILCRDAAGIITGGILTIDANVIDIDSRTSINIDADGIVLTCPTGIGSSIQMSADSFNIYGDDMAASDIDGYGGGLSIESTGGALTLNDLPQTPGAIAPPANFSGTITLNGVEIPYY